MKINKLFLLKDTGDLPISNDKVEIETDVGIMIVHISHFNLEDSDEMAWQLRDKVEKEFDQKITDMASVKVLAYDFCSRMKIVDAIFEEE